MNEHNNRVRELREERGYSLQFVAKRIETTPQNLAMIERGERRLSLPWMTKIAKALDCTPADLLPISQMNTKPLSNTSSYAITKDFAVLGSVDALTGKLDMSVPPKRESIPLLDKLDGSSVVVMPDGSMEPRYHDGQRLLVNPDYPITPGSTVLLEFGDGSGLVRELVSKQSDEWVVKTYRPLAEQTIVVTAIKRAWLVIAAFEI